MKWSPLKISLAAVGAGIGLLGLVAIGVTNSACGVGDTAGPTVAAPAPAPIAKTEGAP